MMETLLVIGGVLLVALAGGTVTIGALKLDFPGAPFIKRRIISKRDAQVKLSELKSSHIITVIYESTKERRKSPATLFHVSDSALRFYNFDKKEKLEGKTAAELMEILQPWLANKVEFEADQGRVQKELQAGIKAVAKVPMIINQEHPDSYFQGKAFHPIIAFWTSEKGKGGETTEYTTVLYLDLTAVPDRPPGS